MARNDKKNGEVYRQEFVREILKLLEQFISNMNKTMPAKRKKLEQIELR